MGQTKRLKKKYETPSHPWQKDRILEEKEYMREYGFRNKKEIWREISKLRKARTQAKKLIADKLSEQARKEERQLLDRLIRYGLLTKDSKLEDVLGLKAKDFFERRLQTLVYKKGLARSVKQARQFIVHGHIMVGENKVTAPSYMVSLEEESMIMFNPRSTLAKEDHPERAVKQEVPEVKKDKKVEEKVEKVSEEETKEEDKPSEAKEEKVAEEVKEEKTEVEKAVEEPAKEAEEASE